MIKVFSPAGWDFDGPTTRLVKIASGGLTGHDRQDFIKRASGTENVFLPFLDTVKLASGEVPVHSLAIGAVEHWSFNRNGDGFKEAELIDRHPTFVKYAKLYRNHRNKQAEGHPHYGRVVASAYNPIMRRVELLSAYNATKEAADRNGGLVADRELEKLARGENLPGSMACLLDPTYPILTRERGYVGIADVVVGDYVWTHKGRWRKVTNLNRRTYTGEVFRFQLYGLPAPLELTADHPMLAKVFEGSREKAAIKAKARRYFKDQDAFQQAPAGWTHAKHVGVGDRFFYRPIIRYSGYGRIVDEALAAVLGYYTAEGSLRYNGERACTVAFTCCLSDSLPRRLPRLIESMFPDLMVDIKPHRESPVALNVEVCSTEFAEMIRKYVGIGCRGKTVPPEIFNAVSAVKLAYLGAWLDGDGWADKKGIHWSSASLGLILQGRDLLASIGVAASIYQIDHAKCATSGYAGSGIEYTLNVSHLDAWQLAGHSTKVAEYPTPAFARKQPPAMRLCQDGHYAIRVKDVVSRFVSDQQTYNFEVEEDESYSAAGLVSHNCRVPYDVCSYCGNEAPNRASYCKAASCGAGGCADNLGKVVKVGGDMHHLGVYNPQAEYFDWSHVHRPAERPAYGGLADYMDKVAADLSYAGVGGAALAEALGLEVPASVAYALDDDSPTSVKLARALAWLDEHGRLPPADLAFAPGVREPINWDTFGLDGTPEKAAAAAMALADVGVVLPYSEFARLNKLAAAPVNLHGVYRRLADDGVVGWPVDARAISARTKEAAYAVAQDYAVTSQAVADRCRLGALRGLEAKSTFSKTAGVGDESAARSYAAYTISALTRIAATSSEFPLTNRFVLVQNRQS